MSNYDFLPLDANGIKLLFERIMQHEAKMQHEIGLLRSELFDLRKKREAEIFNTEKMIARELILTRVSTLHPDEAASMYEKCRKIAHAIIIEESKQESEATHA